MDEFRAEPQKLMLPVQKSNLGVTRSASDVHFAEPVEELSILRLRDRGAHSGDRMSLCLSVNLRDFGTVYPSKAKAGAA